MLALTHTITPDSKTGKVPVDMSCPIPREFPFAVPSSLHILRRLTLTLVDHTQNYQIKNLVSPNSGYDIVAIRPVDDKTLQSACLSLDCDLISLDLSIRYFFHFQYKMFAAAIARGVHIELCYGPGLVGSSEQKRMLIQNAGALIRVTRGRGLIISSECKDILACRGPADIVNLAAIWGLGQERGVEAVTTEARKVVVNSSFRRTSYRGVVDVIYGGERPEKKKKVDDKASDEQSNASKRKFAQMNVAAEQGDKPLSNRQKKKLAKEAREAQAAQDEAQK